MAQAPLPKIFLTHSWRNIEFARRLYSDLRAQGFELWFDDKTLKAGHRMAEEINRALLWCDVYIPVISRAALASEWCWEEINAAITLSMQPGRNKRPRIVTALVEDCAREMPPSLSARLYINFTDRYDEALRELLDKGFGIILPSAQAPARQTSAVEPPAAQPELGLPERDHVEPARQQFSPASPRPKARARFFNPRFLIVVEVAALVLLIVCGIAFYIGYVRIETATLVLPFDFRALAGLQTITQRRGADNAEMVYVAAGDFRMGTNEGEDDEKPLRFVYLDTFWIDKLEVTNALYRHCVDAGKCRQPSFSTSATRNLYYGDRDYADWPVLVSWTDAQTYCAWAGKRLPTEAEWEKAARGVNALTYPWGNTFDAKRLNSAESKRGDTVKVGNFANASPCGALDLAGNVSEWVADWYGKDYYSTAPYHNPKGPSAGYLHVARGGSWNDYQTSAQTFHRFAFFDGTLNTVGFRCAQ
jgi:formylglycine-generating enzyme required for sulfatase activity